MKRFGQKCIWLTALLAVCLFAFLPPRVNAAEAPPSVDAEAYVVMDAATGQVLVSKNPNRMEYPASITKILTMALVLENTNPDTRASEIVTVSNEAIDALIPRASMIALGRGEQATVEDLLYATKIESANDAAHALAEHVSGSMDAFALLMTEKAAELGLTGTNFTNSSGQPGDNHYTTAYDMAQITRWAMGVPGFRELFAATTHTMAPTNMQPAGRTFHDANLIQAAHSTYYCEGVTGSKTGFTDQAQYTLVTTVKRGDTELICVVMKCASNAGKYASTNALMDYCFENFRRVSYTPGQAASAAVPVFGGGDAPLGNLEIYTEDTVTFLLHGSLQPDIATVELLVPERYVIGNSFAPFANITLPNNLPQQSGGQILSIALKWRGLEEIMAANTTEGWQFMAEEKPVLLGTIIGVPAVIIALVVGRLCFVRIRRNKLRKKRLMAARAQLPVRIAKRPMPPSVRLAQTRRDTVDYRKPLQQRQGMANPIKNVYQSPYRAGRNSR